MKSDYNTSYGFGLAEPTYTKTFISKVTERLNEMSKNYKLTGIIIIFIYLLIQTPTRLPCLKFVHSK